MSLVGHSLGAVLAARLALHLGERLDRLVLVAPVGLGACMAEEFFDLMANAHTPASLGCALARLGPRGGPHSEEALEAELTWLCSQREAMLSLGRGIARNGVQQTDVAPLLDRIRAPIAAVFGLDDPVTDWHDCAQPPPRAVIHLLQGASHLPTPSDRTSWPSSS